MMIQVIDFNAFINWMFLTQRSLKMANINLAADMFELKPTETPICQNTPKYMRTISTNKKIKYSYRSSQLKQQEIQRTDRKKQSQTILCIDLISGNGKKGGKMLVESKTEVIKKRSGRDSQSSTHRAFIFKVDKKEDALGKNKSGVANHKLKGDKRVQAQSKGIPSKNRVNSCQKQQFTKVKTLSSTIKVDSRDKTNTEVNQRCHKSCNPQQCTDSIRHSDSLTKQKYLYARNQHFDEWVKRRRQSKLNHPTSIAKSFHINTISLQNPLEWSTREQMRGNIDVQVGGELFTIMHGDMEMIRLNRVDLDRGKRPMSGALLKRRNSQYRGVRVGGEQLCPAPWQIDLKEQVSQMRGDELQNTNI